MSLHHWQKWFGADEHHDSDDLWNRDWDNSGNQRGDDSRGSFCDSRQDRDDHGRGHGQHGDNEQVFTTDLTALNNSGVQASAAVLLDKDDHTVTVEINATGLTPNEVHPQHIHGFTDGTVALSPTIAQDTDHDGFVELAEGQTTYGPILLNLTTNPGGAAHGAGDPMFPTADANGNLHYVETFHFDPNDPASASILHSILPLGIKEIVIHGEDVPAGDGAGTPGEVNGTGGYIPVLPVASGELHAVHGQEAQAIENELKHDQVASGDDSSNDQSNPASHASWVSSPAWDHSGDRDHDRDNDRDDHGRGHGEHENHGGHGDNEQVFATEFTALNNSGVHAAGAVILDKDDHTVTVEIDATGLTPNQMHPQHIHGFTDGTVALSPTLAQDTDHDGFVELAEGQTTYGPILLNLTTNPVDAAHGAANPIFPTADANGDLHYVETFHFDPNDPASASIYNSILPLGIKELVLHGENVAAGEGAGTPGEVNGTGGYIPVLPVASGELHAVNGLEAQTIEHDLKHDQFASDHTLSDFLLGHHA